MKKIISLCKKTVKKVVFFPTLIIILMAIIPFTTIKAQTDATDLLKKMDKTVFGVKDKTTQIKMVMVNQKTGKEKVKKAMMWQKGADMKLFRYTFPKSDSGIATLSLPNNEIYMYLPMFKKPKKITNLAESNAFNKSDFSVKDMASKPYAEQFTGKLLSTNDTAYVVDLTPKSDDISYSHLIVYIDKTNFYPTQFDFYDSKNQMVKKSTYHYVKISGYWVANIAAMENLKKKSKTTIYMSDIKLNQGLKDELFTVEKLAGE